ncbi:MAG: cache domain-containing protein, partial [Anaerotignum sp.]
MVVAILNIDKNDKRNSIKIPMIIGMAVIIIAAVFLYTHSTRANLKQQACYAVQQNAGEIANEINSSIGFAKSSIRLTSQSATQSMDSEVIEDVNAILDPLLSSTPFNFIEYILADGWNTMNDGGIPFDASDREYYKQGIRGNTGIWINFTPKKSKEVLLNFYTPLYYEGEIVGVFTGTLGGDTNMKPLLESTFFGEEMVGFLCDEDGNIIASTVDGLETNTNILTYLTETMGVSEQDKKVFIENADQKRETAFALHEAEGKAIGCISNVEDTGWQVVQIVPAKSLSNILNTTTVQSV